jgi:hypothetical protein
VCVVPIMNVLTLAHEHIVVRQLVSHYLHTKTVVQYYIDFICSRNGGVQYDDLYYPVPTTNYDPGEAVSNSATALARFI